MNSQLQWNLLTFLDCLNIFFIKTNSNLVPDEFVEMASFIANENGRPILVDSEGRPYQKTTTCRNGKTYWKCPKYKSLECPARATTEGNYITLRVGKHNH